MALHVETIEIPSAHSERINAASSIVAIIAFFASFGFLALAPVGSVFLLGLAAIISLAMTSVSLMQPSADLKVTTSKLDVIYAVLLATMLMTAYGIAGGSFALCALIFAGLVCADVVFSSFVAASLASLPGMYSAPVGIAVNIHNRMFGLLGRAA